MKPGDIVLVDATATWHELGSDRLPFWENKEIEAKKQWLWTNERIPKDTPTTYCVACFTGDVFYDLTAPSVVVAVSEDGARVRVMTTEGNNFSRTNRKRISVFNADDVRVFKEA